MHRWLLAVAAAALLSVACGGQTGETKDTQEAASSRSDAQDRGGAAISGRTSSTRSATPDPAEAVVTSTTISDPGPSCTPTDPASTQDVETSSFTVGDRQAPLVKNQVLVLHDVEMCSGQPHLFVGGLTATASAPTSWGADIRCTPEGDPGTPEQQSLRRSTLSTRSHDADGRQELAVRWLFTPDVSGLHDCELRSWGQVPSGQGTMEVVAAEDTELRVSDVERGAVEWRQEQGAYLCADQPDDAGCARSAELLRREVTVAEGAASIDVYAGIEASVCTSDYQDCTPGTAGQGDFTIRTRLIVTQVTGPGSTTMCTGAQPHTRDLTTQVPGQGELDHTKIHSALEEPVPLVRGGDCSPTFVVRVLAEYQRTNSDQPNHGGLVEGAIPDGDPSDPDALNRAYTSAYVVQNG